MSGLLRLLATSTGRMGAAFIAGVIAASFILIGEIREERREKRTAFAKLKEAENQRTEVAENFSAALQACINSPVNRDTLACGLHPGSCSRPDKLPSVKGLLPRPKPKAGQ